MRPKLRGRPGREGAGGAKGRHVVISAAILGLLVTPLALAAGEGSPVLGGQRNPGTNQSAAYTAETQIIAQNQTYGTRQSNKTNGDGGGAIYGCRSAIGKEPCVRASNLNNGRAFEFATGGAEGGRIQVADATGRPLTTNATGVATGFNADKVDDRDAADLVAKSESLFAVVSAAGALGATRGATAASSAAGPGGTTDYALTFNRDVSACAYTATPSAAAPGATVAVQAAGMTATQVIVHASAATALHVTVLC